MKKKLALTMTGIAILLFANSQAFAAPYELGFDDDMGEGISFSEKQFFYTVSYKYDNSIPEASEFMTEAVFFPEEAPQKTNKYRSDNSMDSLEHLMADGICMDTLPKS